MNKKKPPPLNELKNKIIAAIEYLTADQIEDYFEYVL